MSTASFTPSRIVIGPDLDLVSREKTAGQKDQDVTVEYARFLLLDDTRGLELAQFRLRVTQKVSIDFAIVFADTWRRLIGACCRAAEDDR